MPKTTGSQLRPFSEREFYLAEFRRRSIGIAWPESEPFGPAARKVLLEVVAELANNQSRVVVMSSDEAVFAAACPSSVVDSGDDRFGPGLWRRLRERGRAGLRLSARSFDGECTRAAIALRLAKVVWIQSEPPVERPRAAARVSVVDLAHLETLVGTSTDEGDSSFVVQPGKRELLASIRRMIDGGIPSVNVCAGPELARELFTYAGAGILFTRDRYAEVRPLALDDYDPANDLIERGEADGFLVPRDPESRDDVLAHGVGVFIEGRYLAGIGAILPHPGENAGEIASLFALTRYAGEGVGSQIVLHAMERARRDGLAYLFSCTTSDRVERFFLRHGFRRVSPEEVPKAKWQAYDPDRRARVRCLRFDP